VTLPSMERNSDGRMLLILRDWKLAMCITDKFVQDCASVKGERESAGT
jgi:hypothetical protein